MAADRIHEMQEQLKIAQAKMSEGMSLALQKKEEVKSLFNLPRTTNSKKVTGCIIEPFY